LSTNITTFNIAITTSTVTTHTASPAARLLP
jgi:hypothetical protein